MIKLNLEHITVEYGTNRVIDDITCELNGGEMTAIIGRNGVGKTTLIKAVADLTKHSGRVILTDGDTVLRPKKEISYVPQLGSLNTKLTVFEMVLLGLVDTLRWHVTSEQLQQVSDVLSQLRLTGISKQPFNTLSGGQKQLVCMAQSIISKPKVLLLDEPTSALDLRHQLIVMDLAQKYTRETGAVTMFVVHDLMLASRYGKNLMLIHHGKIEALDNADNVMKPEILQGVYGVELSIEKTKEGYFCAVPIRPYAHR